MKHKVALAILCVVLVTPGLRGWAVANADPCRQGATSLLVEHGSHLALVDPGSFEMRTLSIPPEVVRITGNAQRALDRLSLPDWRVVRTSDELGRRIRVHDSRSGEQVFDVAFAYRIELATTSVSSSGRFIVHVQANNIASEVTILDAQAGYNRLVEIPHDAPLAAYAIGIAFSPDERCAAISMERVNGDGAETWLVGLRTGVVSRIPIADVFVWRWRPFQV